MNGLPIPAKVYPTNNHMKLKLLIKEFYLYLQEISLTNEPNIVNADPKFTEKAGPLFIIK
jgi:hypothetical protein